ncbi:hypothetical protein EV127DRAFT_405475 [Xylaria flabelliformis]|nr:hypothetical protein EV127DRAFT_405475 [Xylaria flabelliformis]
MPPAKKKSQTRLTFESVGASSSSPVSAYSPARVRYSRAAHSSPAAARRLPSIATSSSPAQTVNSARKRKSKQSRLDNSIAPPASFMPNSHGQRNRAVANDSSDDSAAEIGDGGHDEDDVDLLPPTQMANMSNTPGTSESGDSDEVPKIRHPRSSQSVSTRLQRTVIDDEDDDQDDGQDREQELPTMPSPRKRRCPSVISLDDSDDAPILPSASSRKFPKQALVVLDDSDENIASPSKKRKMFHHSSLSISGNNRTPGRLKRPSVIASSPSKKAHKGHRSEKQKKMELLRRRRAGEKIDQLSSSESASDEEEKRGIYDTDSEDGLEVLRDFDDEEQEEVKEQPVPRKEKQKREREKPRNRESDEGEGDLDGFVTDDDDAPLGVPVDIPLEFTSHAHKPLKDQFPFVIEWLVHNRINPAFERKDPVYVNAWRKLDDEVSGLANSKFTSAAWKPDFHRALRSRPGLDSVELRQLGTNLYETCEACGRSGHPSTYRIIFSGSAYHKDTLAEVESDSDNEDDNDTASVDSRGMALPPTTKEWLVGSVCCSNAETAHSLLHWKHALKQWVEERLEDEGWMTGKKLSEREKMKAKSRRALANSIVDKWQESGVIGALYGDFKNTIENARNQSTTGRGMKGRPR